MLLHSNNLFQFDFSMWEHISFQFLMIVINVLIAFYVFFKLPKNTMNASFFYTIVIGILIQISDVLMHISYNVNAASQWFRLELALLIVLIPIIIEYVTKITNIKRRFASSKLIFILQYLPSILFIMTLLLFHEDYILVKSTFNYWKVIESPKLFSSLLNIWIIVWSAVLYFIIWSKYWKAEGLEKKELYLFGIGFSFPVLYELIVNLILPKYFNIHVYAANVLCISTFVISSFLILRNAKAINYSPELQWNNIITSLNDAIMIVDNQGRIMYANKSLCKNMEYKFSELYGESAENLFLKSDLEKVKMKKRIDDRIGKISDYYDIMMHSKTGKEIWFSVYASPYYDADGKVMGSLGIHTNISDIRARDNYYNALTKNLTEFITSSDKDANILFMSPSMERALGYTTEEVKGQPMFNLIHPDDRKAAKLGLGKLLKAPGLTTKNVLQLYTKSGEGIWVEGVVSNLTHDPTVNALVANFHDITERIKTEQSLNKLLHTTNSQNERLLNFAYIVSHNIRSHSANMEGILEIIGIEKNEERKLKLYSMLQKSVFKLNQTIANLNDIVNIQTDANLQIAVLNIRQEVIKCCHVIGVLLSKTNAIIHNNVPEDLEINCIAPYMESILLNLVSNAIKYRSPERLPVVIINTHTNNKGIVITIEDNGLGIDLERYRNKLFGMNKTFHGNEDARGLGLYITKNQVESMGGRIEVESELSKGSKFSVYLSSNFNNKTNTITEQII
jgi:PAS domain S-box-containing protein